jgi:hypothetical protein
LPVIVAIYWPTLAVLVAESVSVLMVVAGLVEKEAVTPLGRPATERFTPAVNPFCCVM